MDLIDRVFCLLYQFFLSIISRLGDVIFTKTMAIEGLDCDRVAKGRVDFISLCSSFEVLEPAQIVPGRRFAVFLQAGSGIVNKERFFSDTESLRNWDLIVSHYDRGVQDFIGENATNILYGEVSATKFLSYALLQQRDPSLLSKYEYVLFLDDDVDISVKDINDLFEIGMANRLDFFQAAVSEGSNAEWESLKEPICGRGGIAYFNSVEVMAPVLSKRLLWHCLPLFYYSVSSWGLDLAIGSVCRRLLKSRPAVVCGLRMHHMRKSDQQNGAFYKMLGRSSINPRAEMAVLKRLMSVADYKIVRK